MENKNNIHNLVIGQILYDLSLHEYEVISIGNKYAEIKRIGYYSDYKILLCNLKYIHSSYIDLNLQFYLTKEEPLNEIMFDNNLRKIRKYFDENIYREPIKITLEQTEQIIKILNLKQ